MKLLPGEARTDSLYNEAREIGQAFQEALDAIFLTAIGRTSKELRPFFEALPLASMCFDIAHSRQVDSSMTEAYRLLREFGNRVREVHVSEVNTASQHGKMSSSAAADYAQVLGMVPDDAAFIIEARIPTADLGSELSSVKHLLSRVDELRLDDPY